MSHDLAVIANADGEPVRLICGCGCLRQWKAVPDPLPDDVRAALRAWLDRQDGADR